MILAYMRMLVQRLPTGLFTHRTLAYFLFPFRYANTMLQRSFSKTQTWFAENKISNISFNRFNTNIKYKN
jgi:hypothetical protein